MNRIYLDNNATTMLAPEVAAEMQECFRLGLGNPASQHAAGRGARRLVEEAREGLIELLGGETRGMQADQLVFTSGGTEANNLAIRGLAGSRPGQIIVSAIEHPSVTGPAEFLGTQGYQIIRLPVDEHGVVRLDEANRRIGDDVRLVSVMLGNNETGVIQPVSEVAELARSRGIQVHTDAVQAVGKVPVKFHELGVAALSFSAHKLHGPVGIGGLLIRHGMKLDPFLFGGFQQSGLRPGTESVVLVRGFFKAVQLWHAEAEARARRMTDLRDRLIACIRSARPDVIVNGEPACRLPHTVNVAFPGLDRQALVMALDMAGVDCSAGSACASGSSEPSPVLLAMGLPKEVVEGSIRLSLSALTTESEVDEAARRIIQVLGVIGGGNHGRSGPVPARFAGSKPI